ncbi:uncharacterized protein LOC114754461 [Neltuma alba]|uniref:uncharacterized protein LOC114754461 n=1 Tax=Neltuma alba TaxID=207710 RepID=UPI0010A3222B|nr:uncharacterized protein LOC114754461 [Prosopis alba]
MRQVMKDVSRHKPPTFNGSMDPLKAEAWIDKLETIFKIVPCTTYEQEKETEFFALRQDNKHEDDFIAEFIDLSKYVTYLKSEDNPKWMASQLIEKARPELRQQLALLPFESFEDTCNKLRVAARRARDTEEARRRDNQGRFSNFMKPIGGIGKKSGYGSGSSSKNKGQNQRRPDQRVPQQRSQALKSHVGGSQNSHRESALSMPSVRGPCSRCGRSHSGTCIECFRCHRLGHIARFCPEGQQPPQSGRSTIPGRVYAMTQEEAGASPNMIRGTVSLQGHIIPVLFDSGATHSFISIGCAKKFDFHVIDLPYNLRVSTPAGATVMTSQACLNIALQFEIVIL